MGQYKGQLAVVSTPIGNLGDLSSRAAEMLAKADILACEDTRMTRKLLSLCSIRTDAKLVAYHDHNGQFMRPKLISALESGKQVALVSDAGTPLVSDPGFKLVAACHEAGITITAIPGPSAVLAGLAIAGLPSDQFLFAGFVPSGSTAARAAFRKFADIEVTSIWFDSPKRVATNLAIMNEVFGNRLAVIAREMTKLYEDYHRDELDILARHYANVPNPKGEIVILVAGASPDKSSFDEDTLRTMLREELRENSMRDAIKTVTDISGKPRKIIYALAIDMNKGGQ